EGTARPGFASCLIFVFAPDATAGRICGMAFFGPFATLQEQVKTDARFSAAIKYLTEAFDPASGTRRQIMALKEGTSEKIELPGGAFVINQSYQTRLRPDGFF